MKLIRSIALILAFTSAAYSQTTKPMPATLPVGSVGSFVLSVNPTGVAQPVGYLPVWSSSDPCVALTVASDGMSAKFVISTTANCIGKSVAVNAVTPPYPGQATGASGSTNFTIVQTPYPTSFTILLQQ